MFCNSVQVSVKNNEILPFLSLSEHCAKHHSSALSEDLRGLKNSFGNKVFCKRLIVFMCVWESVMCVP